jgi:hypothetical protein
VDRHGEDSDALIMAVHGIQPPPPNLAHPIANADGTPVNVNPVNGITRPPRVNIHGRQGPIPRVHLTPRNPSGTTVDVSTVNNVATPVSEQTATLAAANAPIRLPYGEVMLGAQIADLLLYTTGGVQYLVILAVWGQGPVQAVMQLYIDDQVPAAGVLVTHYTGAQGAADATLVAAYAQQSPSISYADVLPNICYSVIRIPVDSISGLPQITCKIQGLKMFDPRTAGLTFPGAASTAVAQVAYQPLLDATSVVTVEAWVNTNTNAVQGVFEKSVGGATNTAFLLYIESGVFTFRINRVGTGVHTVSAPTGVVTGRMVHVAGQYDGRFLRLFVDFVQVASLDTGATAGITFGTGDAYIGRLASATTYEFNGTLREVRLWTVARTTAQLFAARHYVDPTTAGLNGYWPLDDFSGTSAKNLVAGGNAAAITGATWSPGPSSAAGRVYSDCPALCAANAINDAAYGANLDVDWHSVCYVADSNDELVSGEKRRTIGLLLDTIKELRQWTEAFRAYAGCFILPAGGKVRFVPDRPTSATFTFSEQAGATPAVGTSLARISNVTKRSRVDVPTVVGVRYTDVSQIPWRDDIAYAYADGVVEGSANWRPREIALPGIHRYSQAKREAIEQLNKLTLSDLSWDVEAPDDALAVQVGDVTLSTANVGITNKPGRVVSGGLVAAGRYKWRVEEYDDLFYSNDVASRASNPDTSLPDPRSVSSPVAPLNLVENFYLENTGASGNTGLIYQSRIEASWSKTTHPYPVTYRVRFTDLSTSKVIYEAFTTNLAAASPAVQQGKTYQVDVYAKNELGFQSAALTATITALGKGLAPTDVPAITFAQELGGDVLLSWSPSIDIDAIRYEWRYAPIGSYSWASATVLDRIDGIRATFSGLPVGTYRFGVKAIDSLGQYSPNDKTVDVTITSDADAFVQSHTFDPLLGNELVVNGDFSSATGWGLSSGFATISGGKLNFTAGGSKSCSRAAGIATTTAAQKAYLVKIVVDSQSAGFGALQLGWGADVMTIPGPGTFTYTMSVFNGATDGGIYIFDNAGTVAAVIDSISVKEIGLFNIDAVPMVEGVWRPRWVTSFAFTSGWASSNLPNPLSAGSNAFASYHPSGTQIFRGGTWDLGASFTGDWVVSSSVTALSGSYQVNIETSDDASTWTLRPGSAWKGSTRFVRPVIVASTTSTLLIDGRPSMTLAALARPESGSIMTSASGPVLVQLANQYGAMQDVQATCQGTSDARAVVDNIRVYPQQGLLLQWDVGGTGATNEFNYTRIFGTVGVGAYTIVSGDWFEYEVWIDTSTPQPDSGGFSAGGAYITSTDGTLAIADGGDGQSGATMRGNGIDSVARGRWYYRSYTLTPTFTGKVVDTAVVVGEGNNPGTYKAVYRNMRIMGSGGVLRLNIYGTTGLPNTVAAVSVSANVSNQKCDPANSFNVYAFNNGGQIARLTNWATKGI